MATEFAKPPKRDEKYMTGDSEITENEFQSLVYKNIPGWTAVWNMLLQENKEMRKRQYNAGNPADLQRKIETKISELLDKEETLVYLYKKAAKVAKKKEEEFKDKTASLMQQIEEDKKLMKTLKNYN